MHTQIKDQVKEGRKIRKGVKSIDIAIEETKEIH